jgi:hypothetical protein
MKLNTVLSFMATSVVASAGAFAVSVPGTACPWLAGMPNGTRANSSDVAPNQSPVLFPGSPLVPGTTMWFRVTGSASNEPFGFNEGGDGAPLEPSSNASGAEHNIGNCTSPLRSLVGVFLSESAPNLTPAPSSLDFSGDRINFTTLSPGLKQVFFIGDGRNNNGVLQSFVVPPGATRLFLGMSDRFQWSNNSGAFEVTLVPAPGVLSFLGFAACVSLRRRRGV